MTLGYHPHHLLYMLYIGMGAAKARITAYTVTGEVHDAHNVNTKVTQGRRILLSCGVTGLSEENEVVSYRWFHSHTGDTSTKNRYEIHDRHPYYTVVKDTLLVDVTSWDQGGKYTCFVKLKTDAPSIGSAAILTVEG